MRGGVIVDTAERFGRRRIDRIGPMDLTVLATDRGSVPMNIGAILEFDAPGGPALAAVRAILSERVPTIPGCVSGCGAFPSVVGARCGSTIPTLCSTGTSSNGNGLPQATPGNCSTLRRSCCASGSTPTGRCGGHVW